MATALAPACADDAGTRDPQLDVGSVDQHIYYGDSAAANFATVELQRYQPGQSNAYCTGFFITRRHIVTAAHCTDPSYSSVWYQVRIKTGYSTFTNLKDSGRTDNWVQLTETTHPGWNFTTRLRSADTAILTIPTTVAGSMPSNQDRLRISTVAPTVNQQLQIWGWGLRTATGTPPRDLLTGNAGSQITVSGIATSGSTNWFYAYVNNNARTCMGDSGGPATRYYSGYYIAVGDHRGPYYVDGQFPWSCAESGVRMDWPTLYDKVSWIESTLRVVYGSSFACTRYSGGYMRCW